jgi:hypothetical protein
MSAHPSLVTLVAVVITAILLISQILFGSPLAIAGDTWQTRVERSPPDADAIAPVDQLDARDEVAALERIQYALSEVGDGSTYVWKRWHGRLSGVIHPTVSFKDPSGQVCRHITVLMTTGKRSSKLEGIACRMASGRWRLEG